MFTRPLLGLAVGNSHLAALRLAYANSGHLFKGFLLDFIGSGQGGLSSIAIENGELIPTSQNTLADFLRFGNQARIPLARYDFFLVVGLGFNIFTLEPLYREHRCVGLKNWELVDQKRTLVSETLFRRMISTGLRASLSARVACLLRLNSDKPIFQLGQPRPAENLLLQKRWPSVRRAVSRGDGPSLSRIFESAASLAVVDRYLSQPENTVTRGLLTSVCFTRGAPRLTSTDFRSELQPAEDFSHANARYGAHALLQLERAISGTISFAIE